MAPNIYYMGAANVVRFGPLRIAGLSGIWKGYNYSKPHHERIPFNENDVKSIYHVRELDVRKLLQIRTQVDVGISHDWPRGIEWKGNWKALFARKNLFEADARAGTLGSTAAKYVMDRLRPPYWFSAHLHVKFAAVVQYNPDSSLAFLDTPGTNGQVPPESSGLEEDHGKTEVDVQQNGRNVPAATLTSTGIRNADEIDIDMDDDLDDAVAPIDNGETLADKHETSLEPNGGAISEEVTNQPDVPEELRSQLPASFARPTTVEAAPTLPPPPDIANKCTHFLALDKCLPNRKFLQILDIEPISQRTSSVTQVRPRGLEYDPEWLAITRVFAADLELGNPSAVVPPNRGEAHYLPLIEKEEEWVEEHIVKPGKRRIPQNFAPTAPTYDPAIGLRLTEQPLEYSNPQTTQFCELLGIENRFHASDEQRQARREAGPNSAEPRPSDYHGGGGRGRGRGRGVARGGFNRGRGGGRGSGRGRGRARGGRGS